MKLIRVFPRRTRATPVDELAHIGEPDMFAEADAVHISVTFSWDMPLVESLVKAWERIAPVSVGGPATGSRGEEFTPGLYLKDGYVITSRGCPNRCWFCGVWKREGDVRELPIRDGWNVLDDNLLACSEEHIRSVFSMLKRQKHRAEFTGGFEAARLESWHVELLLDLNPKQVFFAFDTPDDEEPLRAAGKMLTEAKNWNHALRCYVLIGYPGDDFGAAENRLRTSLNFGFMPMAMLYRGKNGETDREWRRFQRLWARPAIVGRA